ncbi:hypothetical protein B9Z51_06505 [Limnohabitans sp. T6-5]|uniref:glycosyltransferase n=1 Tax=Limnohabitans sp. T6-5 TaxID=1100724 RepID=UPI000D3B1474|nr:glycosyltransferase [Limnohabitans sp. T6-5]PUE08602.1 hypothetical protein B9Z51_06505 [Limnohabitans sp. T6-5]
MKIIFVADFTPVPKFHNKIHLDGKLAEALIRNLGCRVTWIRTNFSHYLKRIDPVGNLEFEKFKVLEIQGHPYKNNISISRMLHNILFSLKLIKILYENRDADRVISPIPSIEATFITSVMARLYGIKHEIIVYDKWPDIFIEYSTNGFFKKIFGKFLYIIYKPLLIISLRKSYKIHCVSNEYSKWLEKYTNKNKNILYIGCNDVSGFESDFNSKIHVVYIGSWGASSNLDLIIKAAKILEGNSNYKFTIAGRVNEEKIVKETSNLRVLGWLGESEKIEIMKTADIGLMIYKKNALQSLPNKIFEYIEYGCFVINTLPGEAEALLRENNFGLTVDPDSPSDLVDAIVKFSKQNGIAKNSILRLAHEKFGSKYYDEYVKENYV